jgi:hypothetical protein
MEVHIANLAGHRNYSDILSESLKLNFDIDTKFPDRDSQKIFNIYFDPTPPTDKSTPTTNNEASFGAIIREAFPDIDGIDDFRKEVKNPISPLPTDPELSALTIDTDKDSDLDSNVSDMTIGEETDPALKRKIIFSQEDKLSIEKQRLRDKDPSPLTTTEIK